MQKENVQWPMMNHVLAVFCGTPSIQKVTKARRIHSIYFSQKDALYRPKFHSVRHLIRTGRGYQIPLLLKQAVSKLSPTSCVCILLGGFPETNNHDCWSFVGKLNLFSPSSFHGKQRPSNGCTTQLGTSNCHYVCTDFIRVFESCPLSVFRNKYIDIHGCISPRGGICFCENTGQVPTSKPGNSPSGDNSWSTCNYACCVLILHIL